MEGSEGIINAHRRVENLALMARLCLLCEDVPEAERHVVEAESQGSKLGSKWLEFTVGWAAALLHAKKGEKQFAEDAFQIVLEPAVPEARVAVMLEYLTTLEEPGEALLDYGKVLASWGEKERAKEILTQARERLRVHGRGPLEEEAHSALRSLK